MSQNEAVLNACPDQNYEAAESSRSDPRFRRLRQVIGRSALVVGLAASFTAASYSLELDDAEPAFASADTYPDSDAPCAANDDTDKGKIDGSGYWCSGYDWGYGSSTNSSRGYGYRNCTDWAAWRVPELTGVSVPTGWSHAKYWDDKARDAGYSVDSNPERGDIAVWDSGNYGHVEVVESVNNDGTVNTSGYINHKTAHLTLDPASRLIHTLILTVQIANRYR